MTRIEGFYWVVRTDSTEAEVANWKDGYWWLTGSEYSYSDFEFSDIEERQLQWVPQSQTSLKNLVPEEQQSRQYNVRKIVNELAKDLDKELQNKIEVSVDDFKFLKARYALAVKNNETEFTFKDRPTLTTYAKYMIEYLTPYFDKMSKDGGK